MDAQIKSIDDLMIDDIIEREGSRFTDDPVDRGGATKYGITQRSWDAYIKIALRPGLTLPSFVRDIDEPMAREFYAVMYVRPLAWIDDLLLRELVLDSAINCGTDRAIRWLQRAAQCTSVDGVIGPETRGKVNARGHHNPERAIHATHNGVVDAREDHYIDIVVKDPTQLKWLRGWMKRLRGLRR